MSVPISYDSEASLVLTKISLFAPSNRRGYAMTGQTSKGTILKLKLGDEKMRSRRFHTRSSALPSLAKAARNAR
jgi:hypothetical protein